MTAGMGWREFEERILSRLPIGESFSVRDIEDERFHPFMSASIQNYLGAQRRAGSETRYVLKRKGRTTSAAWTIGERSRDGKAVTRQFGDDIHRRVKRAIAPDLRRISEVNPRARRVLEDGISKALDSVLGMVDAMIEIAGD